MSDTHAAQAAEDESVLTDAGGDGAATTVQTTDDIETRARDMGWVPADRYRGSKEQWLPADQFVEKVQKEIPVLRERNRYLGDELQKRDRVVTDLGAKIEDQGKLLREFVERNKTAELRGYDRHKREIEETRDAAAAEANMPAYHKANAELVELEKSKPTFTPITATFTPTVNVPAADASTPPPRPSPVIENWVSENKWFESDRALGGIAVVLHGENVQKGMTEADSLKAVSGEMRRRFPERFENPNRAAPAAVNTPSPGGRRPNGKAGHTFDDLPADAKLECDRFCKLLSTKAKPYTREEYVKDYAWETK